MDIYLVEHRTHGTLAKTVCVGTEEECRRGIQHIVDSGLYRVRGSSYKLIRWPAGATLASLFDKPELVAIFDGKGRPCDLS